MKLRGLNFAIIYELITCFDYSYQIRMLNHCLSEPSYTKLPMFLNTGPFPLEIVDLKKMQ